MQAFQHDERSATLFVGSVVAAATTGALAAIGRRVGGVAEPFAAIGDLVVHGRVRDALHAGPGALVMTGVVVHVVGAFVWTVVFLELVRRLGWRDLWAALLVGAAQLGLSWIVARGTGRGIATELALGDRVVLALTLVLSLVAGMRFALPLSRNA